MKIISDKQKSLFDALHVSRTEDMKTFNKKSYRGVWSSIIDKYPETAHFIYELLQNADDAEAEDVEIILKPSEMLLKHNGKKHFDITSEDAVEVGDINSITAIGDSSKIETQNKIGKFGVGFKSVFQYTDTPEIYDDYFNFKIENYIVPTLIEREHPLREQGETLFVFPFKDSRKSYEEISERIKNMRCPILFLRNLRSISIKVEAKNGTTQEYSYKKTALGSVRYKNGIQLQKYSLIEPQRSSCVLLFSKEIQLGENFNHTINVGYFYDQANNKLLTKEEQYVYCFFPTKESFKTCYICHAPFLLTDNRQNLKPGERINQILIKALGELAAQSVLCLIDYGRTIKQYLIDENILDILPNYNQRHYGREIYESPIESAFNTILWREKIFLSRNNRYMTKEEAYTGGPRELIELLSQKQLKELNKTKENIDFLKWEIIKRVNSDEEDERSLFSNDYTSYDFAKDITPDFMNKQDIKWVSKMYTFLRTAAPKLWKFQGSEQKKETAYLPFRKAPIIKLQNGNWVAPYTDNITPNVFLPIKTELTSKYNFIHKEYMDDEMSVKFFQELEIQVPNELDYIRQVVLKRYEGVGAMDEKELVNDMGIIMGYYQKSIYDREEFVNLVKSKILLADNTDNLSSPTSIYFNLPTLREYFGRRVNYFDEGFYERVINKTGRDVFMKFIELLGVCKSPSIQSRTHFELYSVEKNIKRDIEARLKSQSITRYEVTDYKIELFSSLIEQKKISKNISIFLWNEVLPNINLEKFRYIKLLYRPKYARSDYSLANVESSLVYELRHLAWIYNKDGHRLPVEKVFLEDLPVEYNYNESLINLLGIKKREISIIELGGTEEQQKALDFGRMLQNIAPNVPIEELLALAKEAEEKKKNEAFEVVKNESDDNKDKHSNNANNTAEDNEPTDIEAMLQEKWNKKANSNIGKPKHTNSNENTEFEITSHTDNSENNEPFFDETASTANLKSAEEDKNDTKKVEKKLESKNTEAQEAAKKATEQKQIYELLKETPQYTFKWYKLLMELMHADKSDISCRHLQIDFSEKEFTCDDKILHLSNPTQPVPSWILDAEKVSISTLSENPKKIEGVVVKVDDVSIDISIEATTEMKNICNAAKKIRIIADNSTNIIDSLETRFIQLGYEDDYDMNENLTEDIQFIYGPPGTGKTTRLVKMVSEIMKLAKGKMNILVLTPTNKAADVVAEKMVNDSVCYDYLTRFGATESLYLIEEAAVVSNRDTFDITAQNKNVVVTTAARYAYDYIQPDETFLCDYNWDYIIIDEASMVDIVTCTYILHKGLLSKFIISGDPKQIPPVTQNDMPEYNIYDMVELNDFSEAVNSYTRYNVITLKTQHRSIPTIGDLVSKFTYNGIVKADPQRAPQKPLKLDKMDIKDINFIGFDVIDFDLIKGLTSISDSAFQLYSAIFTYKFAEYIIKQVTEKYKGKEYSIGIVSPYKAEADAIKQLLENRPINTDTCSITCGTVHSFQGDECDIMLIVLNPPVQCSRGSHINKQNIINVAMSRARDYIFFIMPQGRTKGMIIKEQLGKLTQSKDRAMFYCGDIEEVMFGNRNHIVSNTHVTCHMPVNVYCEENSTYEVRMSNDALDIKVNE